MAKPSWLTVSPTTGSGDGTINNSASVHTGRVQRTGTVTVQGSGIASPATYTVVQEPKGEFVSFTDGTSMAIDKSGGTVTITGTSNSAKLTFSWVGSGADVSLPDTYSANGATTSNGAAITGDPGASNQFAFSLTLTVPENGTVSTVTRVLKVTANGGQYAQISMEQAAGDPTLSLSTDSITIPQDGTAVSVTVTSNTSWTVS